MSRTAERNNLVETSFENAQALLFLAIGSCFPDAEYTGDSDSRPGIIYYDLAQYILKRKFRDRSIASAKTSTLAAIYTSQNGMLSSSLIHLYAAHSIYADVVKSKQLDREKMPLRGSNEKRWDIPDSCKSTLFPGKTVEEPDYHVFWTRVMLQMVLKVAKRIPPPDFASIESFDDEHLCAFTSSAEFKINIMEQWRSSIIPQLAWNDQDPPSTIHSMASLRVEFYGGVAALLLPYMKFLKFVDRIEVSGKELSKGQQGIIHVIYQWKKYALYNITAFDCIGAVDGHVYKTFRGTSSSLVIMGNPVNTLHIEFKAVLLLQAIGSARLGKHIESLLQLPDEDMNHLYQHTVDRLSRFRPTSRILNQDLEFLRMPWSQISPIVQLCLATTLAV
ncbi:hypothetical protein GGP41_001459 [Bipolaris sorokiniana]|uniref:Transcription factor domain-containing protein n=1 Tax=Cochliobolus sativus TaxID=45130 RepID=A0A8H6DPY3_COCSA|nr:hypothetical protein GGP41_001459 [Bipolaris sorokiniana]